MAIKPSRVSQIGYQPHYEVRSDDGKHLKPWQYKESEIFSQRPYGTDIGENLVQIANTNAYQQYKEEQINNPYAGVKSLNSHGGQCVRLASIFGNSSAMDYAISKVNQEDTIFSNPARINNVGSLERDPIENSNLSENLISSIKNLVGQQSRILPNQNINTNTNINANSNVSNKPFVPGIRNMAGADHRQIKSGIFVPNATSMKQNPNIKNQPDGTINEQDMVKQIRANREKLFNKNKENNKNDYEQI